MAVLTRPLFHAQERIDLEDLNQLLSGLRTDSKLQVREFFGEEQNYILSGFNASGLNTPQLTVDILGASMLFAGKQDPTGISNITIVDNALIPTFDSANPVVISFVREDGSKINLTQTTDNITPTPSSTNPLWSKTTGGSTDALETVRSIRTALINVTEFPSGTNLEPTTAVFNISTLVQGFINIETTNASGFQQLSDSVLNIFDYTGSIVESPSDLSWWTINADATSTETKLTQSITSQFRAPSGSAIRSLIIYATLLTEEATPITKAFWDPSANSGSGAEFNQRVNTAVDLTVQLNVQDSPLTGTELFANTEVCRIDVDESGNILAIRDTRSLYFEGVDTYDWNRTAPFATITTLTTQATGATTPGITPTGTLRLFEPVALLPINATSITDTPLATSRIISTDGASDPTLGLEKFNLSAISGTFNTIIVGLESGGVRVVNTISSNFVRDDKDIGNFKNFIDAVTTSIRQAKGTDNWFDDVDGNIQDALRFINSNIIGESDLAAYQWIPSSSGTDPGASGTFNILASPAVLFELDFTVTPGVGRTVVFGGTSTAPSTTARTFTSVAQSTTTLAAGQWRVGTSAASAAVNLAEAITDFAFGNDGGGTAITVRAVANGNSVVITSDTRNQFVSSGATDVSITINTSGTTGTNGTYTLTGAVAGAALATATVSFSNGLNSSVSVALPILGTTGTALPVGTDITATALAIAAAWNRSTDINLEGYTASSALGVITITPDNVDSNLNTTSLAIAFNSGVTAPTVVVVNVSGYVTPDLFVGRTEDGSAVNNNDLIAVRIFNDSDKFLLRGQSIPIRPNNVLYITLPLKVSTQVSYSYDGVVDFTSEIANQPNYNNTDPIFGELNNPNADNLFEGKLKTIPIGDFVNDGRNYWIAVTEGGQAGSDTLLHVRGVGQLNANEFTPVGSGVTNETITYIGASGTSDDTPDYPSITAIDAFTGDGAYEVASPFNTNTITQAENLTSAISDINNHLVTLKNVEYQDKGMKMVAGGFWTWIATNSRLTITEDAFIQVPGLSNITNTISAATFNSLTDGSPATDLLNDGEVITATINRTDTGSAQQVTLARVAIGSVTPGRDVFIIARRVGNDVYVGLPAAMTLSNGDSSPLDGALSYFGLSSGSGQLPRQLKTVLGSQTTTKNVDIETADVTFQLGGFSPNDIDTTDDAVTLTIPISTGSTTGVLQWEGARFVIPQTGTAGIIESLVSTVSGVFRNRTAGTTGTSFTLPSIPNGSSLWIGLSISAGVVIASGDPDETFLNTNAGNSTFFGRVKGEPQVDFGNVTATANELIFAEFSGDIPIAQIRVTRDSSGNIETIMTDDIVVLGAAGGGGGGGTGDANQELTTYLSRLNLAPYSYVSPIISSLADFNADLNTTDTDAITATTGITFSTTNRNLVTADLLDNDFKVGTTSLSAVEVMGIWSFDTTLTPELPQIDPSARWFITQDPVNTGVDPTAMTSHAFGEARTLTVASVDTTNNTISVLNHGLSTGQEVTVSLTGVTISDTAPFVRVLDIDTIALFTTVRNADANTNRAALTGTLTAGTVAVVSGFLDRVDSTEIVRGDYTFSNPLLTGQVLFTAVATGNITVSLANPAATQSFTLSGSSTTELATNLAASINSAAIATRRSTAQVDGSTVFIYTESDLASETALATTAVSGVTLTQFAVNNTRAEVFLRVVGDDTTSGITERILSSFALFYKYEEGLTGVASNGLDDVSDILRSNHLANSTDADRGYGQAGRGIVLLNNASTPVNTEIALDANNNITIGGTAPITTNGAVEFDTLVANASGIFVPGASSSAGGTSQRIAQQTTAGNYTWTCPADVTEVVFTISGGGGGGGGGASDNSSGAGTVGGGGGGAGGGYIFEQSVEGLMPSEVYTVVVGTAGSAGGTGGGAGNGGAGGAGGTSSINGTFYSNSNITLSCGGGGNGGGGNRANGGAGGGGTGGSVSGLEFFGTTIPSTQGGANGAAGGTGGASGSNATTMPYVATLGNTGLASGGGVDNGGVAGGGGGAGAGMNGAGNGGTGHNGGDHGGGGGGGGGGFTAGSGGGTGNDSTGGTGGTGGLGVMRITYISATEANIV